MGYSVLSCRVFGSNVFFESKGFGCLIVLGLMFLVLEFLTVK